MSQRSEKLAHYIRKAKESHPEAKQGNPDNHDELLNNGFELLKDDLAREFHNQITDINAEPGCMDTLGSAFTDKESRVFKIDKEDKGITIDFNPGERTAEIKGQEPTDFYYFLQVRLSEDGEKWCYVGGETKENLSPVTGQLDTIVDKVLFALFGVEA